MTRTDRPRERIVNHEIRVKSKPKATRIRLRATAIEFGKDIKLKRV